MKKYLLFCLMFVFSSVSTLQSQEETKPPVEPEENPAAETPKPETNPPASTTANPTASPAQPEGWGESWLDGFNISGLVRLRPEARSNTDFNRSTDDNPNYVGQKIQVGIDKKITDDILIKIIFQDSRVWGGSPGSKTGLSTANDFSRESVDVRVAWAEVRNLIGPIDLRAGRQLLKYGDERLVGALEWSNVGRSFDGILLKHDGDVFSSHLFGMVLAESDSDSGGNTSGVGSTKSSGLTYTCAPDTGICTVRAAVPRELDDAYFTGWYNTVRPSIFFQIELYYFGVYKKWIANTTPSIVGAQITTQDRSRQRDILHTFGTRLTNRTQKNKASTPYDWTLEYAVQRGTTGLMVNAGWDILQQTVPRADVAGNPVLLANGQPDTIRLYREKQRYAAWAFSGNAGFTIADFFRIGLEYSAASGDPNRTDGTVSTFNNLFPTNHNLYGQADLVSWQNMIGRSANASIDMGKFGKIRLAYWEIAKQALQDGWYGTTGALNTGTTTESSANARYGSFTDSTGVVSRGSGLLKKHLFREYDITYTLAMGTHLEWGAGYSHIVAGDSIGDVVNDVYSPQAVRRPYFDPRADFAYLMMTLKF